MPSPTTFLRRALVLDAVASGATALLTILGAGLLADLLGLPATLLRIAGLIMVPFIALVVWAALRQPAPTGAVWAIIVMNGLWVLASIGLLVSGKVDPTALGYVFVLGQALAVAVFAELQVMGLRRATAAA